MLTLRQYQSGCAIIALVLVGSGAPACAGTWLQEEGRSQIIFANTFTASDRRFDAGGKPVRAGRFSKQESAIALESGWSEAMTLLAGVSALNQTFPLDNIAARIASGAVSGGARVKLWSGDGTILSLQGTAQMRGERSLSGPLRRMDAPAEADVRLNLGHGFNLGSWTAFAELQAAYRWRGGANADELRLDAALGLRPLPQLLLLFQSFSTVATGVNRRFGEGRFRQHKLQASAVYDLSQNWSLQLGIFGSVAGRNALREQGIQLAWWRRL
jgi:protein XagA